MECELCGTPVKVKIGETKCYEPLYKQEIEKMKVGFDWHKEALEHTQAKLDALPTEEEIQDIVMTWHRKHAGFLHNPDWDDSSSEPLYKAIHKRMKGEAE